MLKHLSLPLLASVLIIITTSSVLLTWAIQNKKDAKKIPVGCYYQQVQCARAPCNPILICLIPSPNPTPNLNNNSPTPTCTPRPKCLDTNPRCMIPETPDMCPPSPNPTTSSRCKVGGCSGELCLDFASPDRNSICIYKSEYACLKYTRCEPQSDGSCGWTPTSEYASCLQGI